ncbi:MAG: hypothetical protein WDN72_00050 [Alphaproteobacteria bacterium]
MTNATSYWGHRPAAPAATRHARTPSSPPARRPATATATATIDTVLEYYRFWQHLGNAGLIPGFYTGAPASPPNATYGWNDVIGTNIPASKLKGTALCRL